MAKRRAALIAVAMTMASQSLACDVFIYNVGILERRISTYFKKIDPKSDCGTQWYYSYCSAFDGKISFHFAADGNMKDLFIGGESRYNDDYFKEIINISLDSVKLPDGRRPSREVISDIIDGISPQIFRYGEDFCMFSIKRDQAGSQFMFSGTRKEVVP